MKEYYLGPDQTSDIDTEYERTLFRSRPSFRYRHRVWKNIILVKIKLKQDKEYERILFRSRPSFRLDPEYERIPEIPPQQSGNPISMILK